MKVNPDLVRLGYTKNWLNYHTVLNWKKVLPLLVKSNAFFSLYLKRLWLSNSSFFFVPVETTGTAQTSNIGMISTSILLGRALRAHKFLGHITTKNPRSVLTGKPSSVFVTNTFLTLKSKRLKGLLKRSALHLDPRGGLNISSQKFETYMWRKCRSKFTTHYFNAYHCLTHDPFIDYLRDSGAFDDLAGERLLTLLVTSLFFKNASLFTFVVSCFLRRGRKHGKSIQALSHYINALVFAGCRITGVRLQISGRFDNMTRASKRLFYFGSPFSITPFKNLISYSYRSATTTIGAFGIKAWIL